jgi:hypothetical protein
MSINRIWQRFAYIFFRPKTGLENIQHETGLMGETYFMLFIFCFLLGLSTMRGGISDAISETAIWYATTLIATFATWRLASKFGATTSWAKSLKVNAFAVSPILLSVTLANIFAHRLLLLAAGIVYSTYILYFAVKIVFAAKGWQKIAYTLAILLAGALSNYIARVLIP